MSESSIGTSASVPSMENRFMFTHARPMKRSRPSTALSRSRTVALLFRRQVAREPLVLDRLAEPLALGLLAEVRELEAHGRRV